MASRDYNPFKSVPRARFNSVQASLFQKNATRSINQQQADHFTLDAERQIAELERDRGLMRGMQPKQEDEGFLGNIPLVGDIVQGGGTLLGGALDVLSRPGTMISGAALGAQRDGLGGLARGALTGAFGTQEERSKMNFATFLEEAGGPFADHEWLRNTVGLGMDFVLDPLNLFAVASVSSKLKNVGKAIANKQLRGQSLANTYFTAKSSPVARSVTDFISPALGTVEKSRLLRIADNYVGEQRTKIRNGLNQFYKELGFTKGLEATLQVQAAEEIAGLITAGVGEAVAKTGLKPQDIINEEITQKAYARLEATHGKPWAQQGAIPAQELPAQFAQTFPEGLQDITPGIKGRSAAEEAATIGENLLINIAEDFFDKEKGSIPALFSDIARGMMSSGTYIRGLAGGKEDLLRIQKGLGAAMSKGDWAGFLKKRKPGAIERRQVLSLPIVSALDVAEKRAYAIEDLTRTKYLEPPTTKKQIAEWERRSSAMKDQGIGGIVVDEMADAAIAGSKGQTGLIFKTHIATTGANKGRHVFTKVKRNGAFAGKAVDDVLRSDEWKNIHKGVEFDYHTPHRNQFVIKDVSKIDGSDPLLKHATKTFRAGSKEYLMPVEMKEMLESIGDPTQMAGILHLGEFFNSLWKPFVTTVSLGGVPLFPAFFVRNAIGLVWNNVLAGVWNPLDYVEAAKMIVRNPEEIRIPLDQAGKATLADRAESINRKYNDQIALFEGDEIVLRSGANRAGNEVGASEVLREILEDGGLLSRRSWAEAGATRGGGAVSELGVRERGKLAFLRLTGKKSEAEIEQYIARRGLAVDRMRDLMGDMGVNLAQREQSALTQHVGRIKNAKLGRVGYMGGRQAQVLDPMRWGRTLNETMDNIAKIAHFRAMVRKGASFDEAIESANKFIGNYTETSKRIQQMSAIIPFYRWTRFNLPLQIEMLIKKPQIASKVGLIEDTVGGMGSENDQQLESILAEGATLPQYMMEKLGVVLGANKDGTVRVVRGFGLPIEDLNKVFSLDLKNTFENLASEVSPILRAPLELATGHSFFTGQPIEDKSFSNFYKRAYNWQEAAPGLREFFGVRKIEGKEGTPTRYASSEPMRMYLLGALFGRVALTVHDGLQWATAQDDGVERWSLLTGVRVKDVHLRHDEKEPLVDQLQKDPDLAAIYDAYRQIPIYPEFNDAELSDKAVRAMSDIQSIARLIKPRFSQATSRGLFDAATKIYADKGNEEGAFLAQQVKDRGYKRSGSKTRSEFVEAYPILRAALEGMSPQAYEWYTGRFDDEF